MGKSAVGTRDTWAHEMARVEGRPLAPPLCPRCGDFLRSLTRRRSADRSAPLRSAACCQRARWAALLPRCFGNLRDTGILPTDSLISICPSKWFASAGIQNFKSEKILVGREMPREWRQPLGPTGSCRRQFWPAVNPL